MRQRVRTWWIGSLAACVLLGGPAVGRAGDPHALDAEAFDRSLRRMQGYLDREHFAKGLRELERLVKRHGRKPYVRARRWELADLAERCAFGAAYNPPTIGNVLRGSVESWKPDKGYLKVRYTPRTAGDLLHRNAFLAFPFDTLGPFVLHVWGASQPSARGPEPVMGFYAEDHVEGRESFFYAVGYGSPEHEPGARSLLQPARIVRVDEKGRKSVLATSDAVRGEVGAPFLVQLKVESRTLEAGVNGKTIGRARKPKDLWGWTGFSVPGWTKAVFEGYIEPSYIDDRVDLLVQRQLAAFRSTWHKEDVLPAWLFDAPSRKTPAPHDALPVELSKARQLAVEVFRVDVAAGRLDGARQQLEALRKLGVPEPVEAYLSARLGLASGSLRRGLQDVERCLAEHPDYLEGLLLRGRLLGRLHRDDEALELFRGALDAHPEDPRVYAAAAWGLLYAGRGEEAYQVVEQAVEHDVAPADVDLLGRVLVKVRKGPTWSRIHDVTSHNYHVASDIGKRTCVEVSKVLEEMLTHYRVSFHWVSRDPSRRYPVYVFRGRTGYDRYVQGVSGARPEAGELGRYSPLLQQLVVRDAHDRRRMLATVRHEGFHQYLDSFLHDAPTWLNEGLAVYFQRGHRGHHGRMQFGGPFPAASRSLREKGWIPLETFVFEDHAHYQKRGFHSYAEAWVLADLLMEGTPRWRKLREDLIADLQTTGRREALEKSFPPDVLRDFESAARDHAAKLAGGK